SDTFGLSGSGGLSIAFLNRYICECKVGLEESIEWAAMRHFNARTYLPKGLRLVTNGQKHSHIYSLRLMWTSKPASCTSIFPGLNSNKGLRYFTASFIGSVV